MSESDDPRLNIPIPDPSLLTREESRALELRLQREFDEKIRALKELVETTFKLFQIQMEQSRTYGREAVDAALLTQKESITKGETATGAQLAALDRRISELKERLDTGEGALRGQVDTRHEQREDTGKLLGISAFAIGVVSILFNLMIAILTLPHAPAVPIALAPANAPPGTVTR